VVGDYFVGDPESLAWAAVIEWLNPAVADEGDYGQGDERFRSPSNGGPSASAK
jgi:hypothetical protein